MLKQDLTSKTCKKTMGLFNSKLKVFLALFIILSAPPVFYSDLTAYQFNIPDLDQLSIAEGYLKINTESKVGVQFVLVKKNKQEMLFSCSIDGGSHPECVSAEQRHFYQNKKAIIWFYNYKGVFFDDYRLFQLEVDGKIIIDYKNQKDKYLSDKRNYIYFKAFFLFVITAIFFVLQLKDIIKKGHL